MVRALWAALLFSIPAWGQAPFLARTLSIDCQESRRIAELDGVCVIRLRALARAGAKPFALVLPADFYWTEGRFLASGAVVRVDLGFAEDRRERLRAALGDGDSPVYMQTSGTFADLIAARP